MCAQAQSLHIGLNAVDSNAYDGWDGTLNACEADAGDACDCEVARKRCMHIAFDERRDNSQHFDQH